MSLFEPRATAAPLAVDILVLPDFSLMSLAATMEPLRAANRVSGRPLYRWRLVSAGSGAVASTSGVALPVDGRFDAGTDAGTVIVVAAFEVRRHVEPLLADLRRLGRRGLPLGGVEAGSWVLAHAGLLDGYRATTHWEDLDDFAFAFPAVEVVPDRYVVDRGRYTTGGATPALEMMLELVRAQHGMALALDVASVFIYDQQGLAADPQRIVSAGRLARIDPRLVEAIRIMEAHVDQPLPVAAIARRVGLSARALQNRFRDRLGSTPQAYYQDLRLNAGRRLLLQSPRSVAEIAPAAGFASASAFARAFRARYGLSPSAARRRAR